MVEIEISKSSGFCFGVVNAIKHAEEHLRKEKSLFSLGEIVHNHEEVKRLSDKGLEPIDYERLKTLGAGETVLFRAHGEAPWVYDLARNRGINVIDATCPVVLTLQKRIRKIYSETIETGAQIVIYGKEGHAEVNGLVGQTDGSAIVISSIEQIDTLIDFAHPVYLFSQTTKDRDHFAALSSEIQSKMHPGVPFEAYDTICRQVANRIPDLIDFARRKDFVYFIAGKNSSNGRVLYETAKGANPRTEFIETPGDITEPLPPGVRTVGISGATSTPMWLMEAVAEKVRLLNP